MGHKEKYYNKIKSMGFRLTNNRIAMIEILENEHLTFKEIQEKMLTYGFKNVASIYNNLEFLVTNKIIAELHIANKIYYDLAIENPGHSNESHIHINIQNEEKITEINDKDIFEYIINHPQLNHLSIDDIKIIINANSKDSN